MFFKQGESIIITYNNKNLLSPLEMKSLVEETLDSDKAEDIVCVDLSNGSALADYMFIATGTSSRHVNALARRLKDKLQSHNVKGISIEGLSQSDWVVMDAGDIIVHLFRPEVREFYNIEKMWCSDDKTIATDQVQA